MLKLYKNEKNGKRQIIFRIFYGLYSCAHRSSQKCLSYPPIETMGVVKQDENPVLGWENNTSLELESLTLGQLNTMEVRQMGQGVCGSGLKRTNKQIQYKAVNSQEVSVKESYY